jgi:hypothetical protein
MPENEQVILVVGPVDGRAARAWTGHMLRNLDVIRAAPERLPFRLPADVTTEFVRLLERWYLAADGRDVFEAREEIEDERLRSLVRYWANLDSLTDQQVADLGVTWSPEHARPFFDALAAGVAEALAGLGDPDPFAEHLADRDRVTGAGGAGTARG